MRRTWKYAAVTKIERNAADGLLAKPSSLRRYHPACKYADTAPTSHFQGWRFSMKRMLLVLMVAVCLCAAGGSAYASSDEKGPVGSLMVSVPNVVGMTLANGMRELGAAGLRAQTQLSDRDGERRVIIRQAPAPGTRLARGSFVQVFGMLADEKGQVKLP
jgi:hypothetical protein